MLVRRRQFLQSAAALGASLALPAVAAPIAASARKESRFELIPADFKVALDPASPVQTGVWSFNDRFPGPLLRFRRGDRASITVRNQLPQETAIHWHGLRVPNGMDGVPGVTQEPIPVGGRFEYRFDLPDSGTYWYHPHQASFEQVPRGLYGALIVEEDKPPRVDRDEVWVLSDIKLDERRQQVEDFGRILDIANDGRRGNQLLVNGLVAGPERKIAVRSGERLRLRLINAASARFFKLSIEGHAASIVAWDGQGLELPQTAPADGIVLGPGMRVDLILDCMEKPGGRFEIRESARPRSPAIVLGVIAYTAQPALRAKPLATPILVPPNVLPEPDLAKASDHYIMFQGGMRGAPTIGMVDGKPSRIQDIMARQGLAWTMNYNAQHEHALMHEPLLTLSRGEHVILHMVNETDFVHPMHLHGHFFRVVGINGVANPAREWRDTVIMAPRQSIDVAFIADNPGEWMYHCHILDHAAGGMMGTIVVE
ncbi:MAG: multicopper oxidase family protein [Sulfuritalea sp.]|nr:multicopper oxidase family protein [Sulfuritalea sp.]